MLPNGFSFEGTDTAGMDYALNRALSMWYSDRAAWQALTADVMSQDWSWDGPALDYLELYYKVAGRGSGHAGHTAWLAHVLRALRVLRACQRQVACDVGAAGCEARRA